MKEPDFQKVLSSQHSVNLLSCTLKSKNPTENQQSSAAYAEEQRKSLEIRLKKKKKTES